ncbi:DNA repair protein RecN [Motiliproteus sp. MSK22-1]|uniref:DNA repair protein RecN n=1 Tax=Motiliproteus sp. MSK22-1 TaxID=1897630 RepID=UPI0009782327|nr:DNA repair protein RecN [Motiliproteus sp. MSK22-1]OMH39350.1 DNA repair protein RecN [Motiliproteus sp. MSK22-1]
MLTQLSIRNFTLIDHLDLELDRGMTVISGETGAGKSIMLDALGLTLGDRADSDMVRNGTERADISACFDITAIPSAKSWLKEQDLANNDDCLLRRVVSRNGRSRAYINGHPVPLQSLRNLGERLIDIHGQHEHQRLLKKESHSLLLDAVGHLSEQTGEVSSLFKKWKKLSLQLERIQQQSEEQNAQQQLLTYQVQELDLLSPQQDELASLEAEQKQLSNAGDLMQGANHIRHLTTEGEDSNCSDLLNQSLQQLAQLNADSVQLENSREMLNSALIQIEEASSELEAYLSQLEINPQRLNQVEERLSEFYQIARKHQISPEQLYELHQTLSDKLAAMTMSDDAIEELQAHADEARDLYMEKAAQLSTDRQRTAESLNSKINEQLQLLGMPASRFLVGITEKPPCSNGMEDVEFLISTNPGQPPKPLHKVASGGELSRISLAIQVVTARVSATPVLAFDEVDVGIGGAIAEVVGRLLRELGEHSQILCVTHQPQVASRGHNHLYVSKHINQDQLKDDSSHSRILMLSPSERVKEIARMLGGIDITQRSLDHAEEMLALE